MLLYLTGDTPVGLHGLLREYTYIMCGDDICTSEKTYLKASTVCYGDKFTLLNVDDVRTS
jgi:hypothetical protein